MSRVRAWLAVWCGWTALALFFAVSTSLTYRTSGRPALWTFTLQRSLSEWWLWALLTPLVVFAARRFPVHGRHLVRHTIVHVVIGMVVAVGKTLADRAIFALVSGFWTYILFTTLALQFTLYAAVVAAAHGVEYYRRSREREQLEAQLAETRLHMLNMQLQPHFLFNTLNTIAEMVHENPDKADTMIGGLSDLLRRTLDLGAVQEITVAEEVNLVERYLDIQKARFGERLRVHVAVADTARGARVPALLLQPIVENAIRHGLTARMDAGRIDIDVRAEGQMLVLTVTDDGSGDPDEVITGPERVGLGNTRARLDALYSGAARLALGRAEGRGARVTIEIPLAHRSPGEGGP
jgi:two-component system LytT family sensor kinase